MPPIQRSLELNVPFHVRDDEGRCSNFKVIATRIYRHVVVDCALSLPRGSLRAL